MRRPRFGWQRQKDIRSDEFINAFLRDADSTTNLNELEMASL